MSIKHFIYFLGIGFGSGKAPIAPGTFGTLAAIPLYLLMQALSEPVYLMITLLITLVGIPICHISAAILGVHDHPSIVWDEIAGFLITMAVAPPGWEWIVIGFIYFRVFDIWKPWPISSVDKRLHGGLGIMLDDVIAGVFSLGLLQATAYLFFYVNG